LGQKGPKEEKPLIRIGLGFGRVAGLYIQTGPGVRCGF
jgi:hypothetical protein